MFDYLYKSEPIGSQKLPKERSDKIKASVLSKIEEDKPMKTRVFIKPLIIAAAVSATALASLVTANAATDGAISDTITEKLNIIFKGKPVDGVYTYDENGEIQEFTFTLPDNENTEFTVAGVTAEGENALDDVTITINGEKAEIINGGDINPDQITADAAAMNAADAAK